MSLELLTQAGLTPTQAEILGYLLSLDQVKAKDIIGNLKKPRGVIYKGLEELITLGLVRKIEKTGLIARFQAEHPSKIDKLFENREKQAQLERKNFLDNLPALASSYMLVHRKPEIRFYEGVAGIRQALDETLRSKTELLYFLSEEELVSPGVPLIANKDYTEKRLKAGIKLRIIIAGTKPIHNTVLQALEMDLSEIRYLGAMTSPFKSSLKIYDNKIAYQTNDSSQAIITMIENGDIYEINKNIFEHIWQFANK
jgi:sugar-specific transcriptional regulator TrmB